MIDFLDLLQNNQEMGKMGPGYRINKIGYEHIVLRLSDDGCKGSFI